MAKRKEPTSWVDQINAEAANDESQPAVVAPPLYTAAQAKEMYEEMTTSQAKCRANLEIKVKVLERDLYLAKARIADLELMQMVRASTDQDGRSNL